MNKLSQLQVELAANVQRRISQIDTLIHEPPPPPGTPRVKVHDEEVTYWRRRIAALSVPVTIPQSRSTTRELKRQSETDRSYYSSTRATDMLIPPMRRLQVERRARQITENSSHNFGGISYTNSSFARSTKNNDTISRIVAPSAAAATDRTGLCTACWEPPSQCRCNVRRGPRPAVLCKICFDVPCACRTAALSGSRNGSGIGRHRATFLPSMNTTMHSETKSERYYRPG